MAILYLSLHLSLSLSLCAIQPDPEDFCEEQWLVAKLVHLLKAEVVKKQYVSAADQQYVVSII